MPGVFCYSEPGLPPGSGSSLQYKIPADNVSRYMLRVMVTSLSAYSRSPQKITQP